jgi:N6-L-threonylcarbamoyladenine synthase
LKTAVRQAAEQIPAEDATALADLAASVELAICDTIIDRTANALRWFRQHHPAGEALVAAGGVAANTLLRTRLRALAEDARLSFVAPPPALCTDNGAMVAWAGLERLRLGLIDPFDAPVHPRWPLGEVLVKERTS